MKLFNAKAPQETVTLTFDLSADLAPNETLSSPVSSVALVLGTDPTPQAFLSGAPIVSGSTILQSVTGGVLQAQYNVRACANTSAGRVLCLAGVIPVADAANT
jgi:hypothetical protein